MATTVTTKNQMLGAITVDEIRLHSGDPGASGTANAISGATAACSYGAASGGSRDLSAAVTGIPVPAATTVSHFSLWAGSTLKAYKAFDSGSETYNNAGTANVTSAAFTVADVV
jgi:hypothetical protein